MFMPRFPKFLAKHGGPFLVAVTLSYAALGVASAGMYAITPAATALAVVKRDWRRFGFGNPMAARSSNIDLFSFRRKRGSVSPIVVRFSSPSGSTWVDDGNL